MIRNIARAVPACLFVFASTAFAEDVVDLAAALIGRPYVWGAEGPIAFDCSGLTQYVYQQVGVELPRRAISQSKFGHPAGSRFHRGDLLFFSTDTRRPLVTHVGLYEGDGLMIDASKSHGRVRRDNVDDPYWVERFMFARRVDVSTETREATRRRDPNGGASSRSGGGRGTAIRVIERIAGELFKLPRVR